VRVQHLLVLLLLQGVECILHPHHAQIVNDEAELPPGLIHVPAEEVPCPLPPCSQPGERQRYAQLVF